MRPALVDKGEDARNASGQQFQHKRLAVDLEFLDKAFEYLFIQRQLLEQRQAGHAVRFRGSNPGGGPLLRPAMHDHGSNTAAVQVDEVSCGFQAAGTPSSA